MAQGWPQPSGAVGVHLTLTVGTSGWSYADWVGPVYPERVRARPDQWLALYGERFSTVEVNSTFYRLPTPAGVAGWVGKAKQMGGSFEFSVKAPQGVTHGAMVSRDRTALAAGLGAFRERVAAPLAEAGLLGAVLLQLSPYFPLDPGALAVMEAALEQLAGFRVAVEPRHRSWHPGGAFSAAAAETLRRHGAALAWVDGPGFPLLMERTAGHGYVRFHGRRSDVWFSGPTRAGQAASERYDYLYTEEELEPWVARLRAAQDLDLRVYFNNHPGGKAVENARWLAGKLGIKPPVRAARPRQRGLAEFDSGP